MVVKLVLVMYLLWELHVQVAVLKDDRLNWISNDNVLNSLVVSISVHLELFCSIIHSAMLDNAIVLLMMILANLLIHCFVLI